LTKPLRQETSRTALSICSLTLPDEAAAWNIGEVAHRIDDDRLVNLQLQRGLRRLVLIPDQIQVSLLEQFPPGASILPRLHAFEEVVPGRHDPRRIGSPALQQLGRDSLAARRNQQAERHELQELPTCLHKQSTRVGVGGQIVLARRFS
jgi:hypothetical protein